MREANLKGVIERLGWNVNDKGNVNVNNVHIEKGLDFEKYSNSSINNCLEIGALCKKLSEHTFKSTKNGNFTLALGGDHSIATGSIFGVK